MISRLTETLVQVQKKYFAKKVECYVCGETMTNFEFDMFHMPGCLMGLDKRRQKKDSI